MVNDVILLDFPPIPVWWMGAPPGTLKSVIGLVLVSRVAPRTLLVGQVFLSDRPWAPEHDRPPSTHYRVFQNLG